MYECTDKLILETILQDKFSYFKAEERGVAVATATDDNAEIRNLDVRLFKKSTCWYTRACLKNHSRNLHAPLCGIFCPLSVGVARYAALNRTKSPTNCDAHLAESLFQTRSRIVIVMRIMHPKQYPVPALYSQVRKKNGEYPPGMFQEFYVRLVHSEGRLLS